MDDKCSYCARPLILTKYKDGSESMECPRFKMPWAFFSANANLHDADVIMETEEEKILRALVANPGDPGPIGMRRSWL